MKFFKCPCCNKLHFTRLNGLSFENPYKTLKEHTIKKRLKCGKCHNNLAIFINNKTSETKIIWEEYYKIYDDALRKLLKTKRFTARERAAIKFPINANTSNSLVLKP